MKLGPIQEQWLKELESGKWGQGPNFLGIPEENKWCCLGVALQILKCGATDQGFLWDGNFSSYENLMVSHVRLGLRDGNGTFTSSILTEEQKNIIGEADHGSLTEMNDAGVSFTKIASFIRSKPEVVFVEAK